MAERKELYLGYTTDKAVTPFMQDFLERLDEEKLMKSVCTSCSAEYLPPRQHCQKCMSETKLTEMTEREAKLYSYVIVDFAPETLSSKQPYVVAIGQFPSGLKLTAHITNLTSMPEVGMPLKLGFAKEGEGKMITYRWLV
ncbi:MAG: Zn-ribbon domain-containing OB-fold protein [Candidatus Thorarchaeota archaeon]